MNEQDQNELRAIYDELTTLIQRLRAIECGGLAFDLENAKGKIPTILKNVE